MPAFPIWYPRAREILATLNHPNTRSIFDRRAIEHLFGIQKRQAIRLLKEKLGGHRFGQNFMVDRATVVEFVENAIKHGGVAEAIKQERYRQEKKDETEMIQTAKRGTTFQPDSIPSGDEGLPEEVQVLGPGQLLINHQGAADLVARMHRVLTRAGKNFSAFQKLIEGRP